MLPYIIWGPFFRPNSIRKGLKGFNKGFDKRFCKGCYKGFCEGFNKGFKGVTVWGPYGIRKDLKGI